MEYILILSAQFGTLQLQYSGMLYFLMMISYGKSAESYIFGDS